MIDERFAASVSAWLRRTDSLARRPDDNVGRAMAQIHRTRQHRRWLRFLPGRTPTAGEFDEPGGTSSARPAPIAGDLAPEPLRGTRTMLNATKLVAASAILAVSAAFLASGALTPEPKQPQGAASDPAEVVAVSGSGSFSGATNATGSSEMDDPRVSGDWVITQELHCDPNAGGYTCAKWGQAVLSNDRGTWEGEWAGLHHPVGTGLGLHYLTTWLSGTGDYEGLYYVASLMGDPSATVLEGVIYEGPFPATVALGAMEPAAE